MNQLHASQQINYSIITLILSWTGMVVMSSLYLTIPLITIFREYFTISLYQAGLTSSIFSLGFAAGCFIYGAIAEKYGRKNVIVFGLIALSSITLCMGTIDNFTMLLLFRGLQGFAAATFSPVALAYTLEEFPLDRKVGAVGFISTGFLVAGIIGQVFSSFISEHLHWHTVFYILGSIYLMTTLLIILLLPKDISYDKTKNIWRSFQNIGVVFKCKNLLCSYVIAFVLLLSFVSMYIILGEYVASSAFQMESQSFMTIRLFGILGMMLSPFAGKLAQRFSILQVLRFALSMAIIALLSMGFISNLMLLTLVSIIFVGGIALAVPSLVSLIGQLGGVNRGMAVSMYTVILFAGTSLAPLLSVTFTQSGNYSIAFALLAATLSVGLIAALCIHNQNSAQIVK